MTVAQEGGCRCGQVQFRVSGRPMVTMACHCTGCRRMTASAYSLSSLYAADRFKITAGEPVIGGLRGETRHFFCPSCMSWLFTRPAGMDTFVNLRSTMLDDPSSHSPFIETWTSEKLSWAETGATHSFDSSPLQDEFPVLLAEYAAPRS